MSSVAGMLYVRGGCGGFGDRPERRGLLNSMTMSGGRCVMYTPRGGGGHFVFLWHYAGDSRTWDYQESSSTGGLLRMTEGRGIPV